MTTRKELVLAIGRLSKAVCLLALARTERNRIEGFRVARLTKAEPSNLALSSEAVEDTCMALTVQIRRLQDEIRSA